MAASGVVCRGFDVARMKGGIDMDRDRLGRRRQPDQERGLRPLHPPLPEEWVSRALRLAMSESDWSRFEALVREVGAGQPTRARACGVTLSQLIHVAPKPQPEPSPLDWMDWERRKTLRLLLHGRAG